MASGRNRAVSSELSLLEIKIQPLRQGREDIADEYELLLEAFPNLTLCPIIRPVLDSAGLLRARLGLKTPACADTLCLTLTRPTWGVLDNAPQHTSQALKARLPEGEKAGLFLYYLPPYSPELNLIEILWRFIQYCWLPFTAYQLCQP